MVCNACFFRYIANLVKIYCLQEEEFCLQFFFFCILGSQQVLITKGNSHVMLFSFQYTLKIVVHYTYVVRFAYELIIIQVILIKVPNNYWSKCDGFTVIHMAMVYLLFQMLSLRAIHGEDPTNAWTHSKCEI